MSTPPVPVSAIESWMERLCQDETHQYNAPDLPNRPLSLETIRAITPRIQRDARRLGVRSCLIGGGAVLTHLAQRGFSGAPARSSLDLDFAADGQVMRVPIAQTLRSGGYTYHISAPGDVGMVRIDWIVRSDIWRALYWDAIAQAEDDGWGVRVAKPNHLVAMKIAMLQYAMRPKDRDDVRLLLQSRAATIAGVLEVCSESMTNMRSSAEQLLGQILE